MKVNKQAVQDATLMGVGTALLSAGVSLITSAGGDNTKIALGAGLCVIGLVTYYVGIVYNK
jgi:drug/metabolite transporter (DMT)-like permease